MAAAGAVIVLLSVSLLVQPVLGALTRVDDDVLRWLASLRTPVATDLARWAQDLGSPWTARVMGWATIAVLLAFRRFRHLAVYLAVLLTYSMAASLLAVNIGRMRPSGITILSDWTGYSYPARPVGLVAVVVVGALYTLVPAGRGREVGLRAGLVLVAVLSLASLYLAVAHPSDVAAAVVLGWAFPATAYRLAAPDEAFPVTYRRRRAAHVDLGGRRGQAIRQALEQQLGMHVVGLEPFGLSGSAGSTPMRIRVQRSPDGEPVEVFGKLYAVTHLRSDRWYKIVRTVLYGRLEDEKPFSTVRRLVEYEDHMLRLFRDEHLPSPRPFGFVEITPDREYLIVMEMIQGASEIGDCRLDDAAVSDGLAVVRRLWDAGIAHRDIKPSNVLVRSGRVYLIDVAFATIRPTPWRQAVDLANMMLTLALSSTAGGVYEQAGRFFTQDEIAEALAASHSITVPSQLRARLRGDHRDVAGELRRLAPQRRPVAIQLWDFRRLYVTISLLAGLALAGLAVLLYVQTTSLL